jgi:hypothetical protein
MVKAIGRRNARIRVLNQCRLRAIRIFFRVSVHV